MQLKISINLLGRKRCLRGHLGEEWTVAQLVNLAWDREVALYGHRYHMTGTLVR